MCRCLGVLALAVVAATGCGRKHPADKVTRVADDDPQMNAAIEKARSTADTFIAVLKSPKPGQSGFSVKMLVSDGTNHEHIWLSPVVFDGKVFRGMINNKPDKVTTIKMGERASVEPSEISDWMYIENR